SEVLPEEMSGADFLDRYDGLTDTATHVRPERRYPVRRATEHPVREHERVGRFAELLGVLAEQPGAALELGRLMYESHQSYGACGLGGGRKGHRPGRSAAPDDDQGLSLEQSHVIGLERLVADLVSVVHSHDASISRDTEAHQWLRRRYGNAR